MAETDKLTLITTVAASYLRRNSVGVDQIGTVISSVTRALDAAARQLEGDGTAPEPQPAVVEERRAPAVSIKKSVQHDHIVCLEDGIKVKTLKRHLSSAHDLTPQQYREKWRLPKDYPLVAPSYSERRSKMAKDLGLGRKAGTTKSKRGRRAQAAAAKS